jgi:hypothetical protein
MIRALVWAGTGNNLKIDPVAAMGRPLSPYRYRERSEARPAQTAGQFDATKPARGS